MSLTETTTLDEVLHDVTANTVTVTWRDHIFRGGEEINSARTMRQVTYSSSDIDKFNTDLGSEASKYGHLFSE